MSPISPLPNALVLCLLAPVGTAFAAGTAAPAAKGPALVEVAHFEHQATGVAVAEDGRTFVNFPRWTEDAPISVGEVVDGKVKPYPDEEWNSWRNAKKNEISPKDHFVCVQSVVADGKGSLWVVDPAAPATGFLVPAGPKLVRIDLKTNKVADTIAFDQKVAPQGTYLNDVRLSPDGTHAYLTDSGPTGALIVVDLKTGKPRRLLSGHPTVQAEKDVVVKHDGQPIRRPDGRGIEFSADGIELSKDGETLYWQAVTGHTLYSISTKVLDDEDASADQVAAAVKKVGENGVSDGLWLDRKGRMYISDAEDDAVKRREGDKVSVLLQDERLRWPDTFSQGPDGAIYVTASRIMDMSWYKPDSPIALSTTLFKFDPDAEPGAAPAK